LEKTEGVRTQITTRERDHRGRDQRQRQAGRDPPDGAERELVRKSSWISGAPRIRTMGGDDDPAEAEVKGPRLGEAVVEVAFVAEGLAQAWAVVGPRIGLGRG